MYIFQIACRLYVTEEKNDAEFGPLVDDIIELSIKTLNFTE